MSTILESTEDANVSLISPQSEWRWSLAQYHAMIEKGILHSGDPVEFLEGHVLLKMTRPAPHRIALAHLRDLLVSIVVGSVDDYPDRHPRPTDIGLVVKVADSTLNTDRGLKKRIYARAAIYEYWIVNLVERQIEVYSEPSGPADEPNYGTQSIYTAGQIIPVKLRDAVVGTVPVSHVLPG